MKWLFHFFFSLLNKQTKSKSMRQTKTQLNQTNFFFLSQSTKHLIKPNSKKMGFVWLKVLFNSCTVTYLLKLFTWPPVSAFGLRNNSCRLMCSEMQFALQFAISIHCLSDQGLFIVDLQLIKQRLFIIVYFRYLHMHTLVFIYHNVIFPVNVVEDRQCSYYAEKSLYKE